MIFRAIDITWAGATYTIEPNLKLVRAIEREVSILGTLARAEQGQAPISHIAFIVSALLRSAGASAEVADEEKIYQSLFTNQQTMTDAMVMLSLTLGVDPSSPPEADASGNPQAPE